MYCCISGCSSSSKTNKGEKRKRVNFYYFPANSVYMPWLCEKREKWINAVKKHTKDPKNWHPTKNSTICSAHFIGNKKSEHTLHPSYIPTIFPGEKYNEKTLITKKQRFERHQRRMQRADLPKDQDSKQDLPTTIKPARTSLAKCKRTIAPGQKNFSWQEPNEVVPILADDVKTEVVVENLSMYCDDGEQASQMSEQLDEKYKGGPVIPATYEMFRCNVCNSAIAGFRYTCVQCSDLDLCGACEAARAHHHHYVLRVPADRLAAEVQLVMATIRRHLMRKLDPITQHGQDQDDAISFKSEIKLEPKDYEYNDNDGENYNDDTKNKLLEDGVLKRSSSPGPPQHGIFDGEAQPVDEEDQVPRGECGEAQGKNKPNKIIYMKLSDYMKIKERGLPWDAQPRAEEVVIPSEATPPRPRVLYASTQMQRKFIGMLQDMNQKDLQTKIMKAQDIDEDPLSQVNIVQTSLIDAGQLDLVDSKIVATGAKRDIVPRVGPEAIARDVHSTMGLPDAHRVKPECSAKLKRLQSQILAHAGNKPVASVTTDPCDSKTTIPTTSTPEAEKRTKIIEQAESGDTRHTVSVKKRCLSSDMSRDTTKTTLVQSDT